MSTTAKQQRLEREAARLLMAFECGRRGGDGHGGLFVLGCADKGRNTVISQQHRAISLINALDCLGQLEGNGPGRKRAKIAVVGGGVAGITAAVCAVNKGVKVDLFEEEGDVVHVFDGANHRMIHPGLFNWPRDQGLDEATDLRFAPELNWTFSPAGALAAHLRDQFHRFATRNRKLLKLHLNSPCRLSSTSHLAIEPLNGGKPARYTHVIVAVGFGREPAGVYSVQAPGYWDGDDFATNRRKGECLVVGTGDGGLIDCLRLRCAPADMAFEQWAIAFLKAWHQEDKAEYERCVNAILKIEGPIPSLKPSERVFIGYMSLKVKSAKKMLREHLRDDTSVTLVHRARDRDGRPQFPLGGWQSPLNRFLMSLLIQVKDKRFRSVPGSFERDPHDAQKWVVKNAAGKALYTSAQLVGPNSLVLRVGPGAFGRAGEEREQPLDRFSSEVAKDDEERLRILSALDFHATPFEYPPAPRRRGAKGGRTAKARAAGPALPAIPSTELTALPVVRRNPYLLGGHVFGRDAEWAALDRWLADDSPARRVLCVCDYGGGGKTALVWAWLTAQETQRQRERLGYAEFWTSFYARDYDPEQFIADLAAALDARAPRDPRHPMDLATTTANVLFALKNNNWLIVLDGLERQMEGYASEANFGMDSEEQDARKEADKARPAEREIRHPALARFLRDLRETKAKVVISSRHFPEDLKEWLGAGVEQLDLSEAVLRAEDARRIWDDEASVGGSDVLFRAFFEQTKYHPQTIRVVAAAVDDSGCADFDGWYRQRPPEAVRRCEDASAGTTARRHRWLEMATADLPTRRPDAWVLLCRVASKPDASTRADLANALVKGPGEPLFRTEREMIESLEYLQRLRLLGYDPATGNIDVHPVLRTVVYRHVTDIKDSRDPRNAALWAKIKAHVNEQELLLKELSNTKLDQRVARLAETRGFDSRARLELFQDFYPGAGDRPWMEALPALASRRDQASVDFLTAAALGDYGDFEGSQFLLGRAALLCRLNADEQGLIECRQYESWLRLYGGALFDCERHFLRRAAARDRSEDDVYMLASTMAVRRHPLARPLLNALTKGEQSRWTLQTAAEDYFYLGDYRRAMELAAEAQQRESEKVLPGQELWELVTLGMAEVRVGQLARGERHLRDVWGQSGAVHYSIVRLFALAGLTECSVRQAGRANAKGAREHHLSEALSFLKEYEKHDGQYLRPIPASIALCAKAEVLQAVGQPGAAGAAASQALTLARGRVPGFGFAGAAEMAAALLAPAGAPAGAAAAADVRTADVRRHDVELARFVRRLLKERS